ncbi:E3 ubiquitin-protein ligase RNF166-like [Eriocheir sinensis]|uniref:E3 ubiquitin-protein ligase RNF166-like n=1 Tax=Eriocheir sinensis TaxID=95602 RepID=UPI0021CA53A3|nr:E3 ubiquitin-protein ligase RNF166-like [Eriocheir sinensis]
MGICAVTGMKVPTEASTECPVCLKEYDRSFGGIPRFLKCGHTFCASCLLHMIDLRVPKSPMKCPLCRENHHHRGRLPPFNPAFRGALKRPMDTATEVKEARCLRITEIDPYVLVSWGCIEHGGE